METIRTIHYLLADSLVAPGLAGQIRDDSVSVSGTTYAPLEGRERLSRLLMQLIEKANRIEDPFEQSFFLLGHNKRTARLACVIPLIKHDYLQATIVFYELNEVAPLADLYWLPYTDPSAARWWPTLSARWFHRRKAKPLLKRI